MQRLKPKLHNLHKKGSTLILVLIMTAAATFVVGSILRNSLNDARRNQSDLLRNESRLAMEAVLNHGMAQLRDRFDRTRQLSESELYPDKTSALQLEPGFLTMMKQSRAKLPNTYNGPVDYKAFIDQPVALGGLVVNSGIPKVIKIDPNTKLPERQNPGVPTDAEVREVRIYAKATVTDAQWGSIASYGKQTFQILDQSLFQNATFFNGLLEIFPGGQMNLGMGGGPIYAAEVHIGNNTRIHTRIETSGSFKVGRYHNSSGTTSSAKLTDFAKFDGTTPANPNSVSYLEDLKSANPDGSLALQTGEDGFRELALQEYNGGLLTSEHGITPQSAVGLEFLRELALADDAASGRDYTTSGEFDQGLYDRTGSNFGHLLIEPSRSITDTSFGSLTDEQKESLEAHNSVEESKWANRSALSLKLNPSTDTIQMYHQKMVDGKPSFEPVTGERTKTEIDISTVFADDEAKFWEVERFEQSGGKNTEVEGGLYDFRQAENSDNNDSGKINLLRIDVAKMKKWVEESWDVSDLPSGNKPSFDDDWWNGGIYVEMPEQAPEVRTDGVVAAVTDWAVQVHDATTLPNRATVDEDAPVGLTISTNGALYVQGTYNAPDGLTWDEDTFASSGEGVEVPAALVADAIMLLSDEWDNKNSGLTNKSKRTPTDTVYSTALVMGNVPSTSSGSYSGGLENFPRFLEFWGGKTASYRGSLIRLFRSEAFNAKWRGGNVYSPPKRNWAFHTGFRDAPPPLDVGPRKFRKVYFKELTKAEFEDETIGIFGTVVTP